LFVVDTLRIVLSCASKTNAWHSGKAHNVHVAYRSPTPPVYTNRFAESRQEAILFVCPAERSYKRRSTYQWPLLHTQRWKKTYAVEIRAFPSHQVVFTLGTLERCLVSGLNRKIPPSLDVHWS
jgi:hypothetical protein